MTCFSLLGSGIGNLTAFTQTPGLTLDHPDRSTRTPAITRTSAPIADLLGRARTGWVSIESAADLDIRTESAGAPAMTSPIHHPWRRTERRRFGTRMGASARDCQGLCVTA